MQCRGNALVVAALSTLCLSLASGIEPASASNLLVNGSFELWSGGYTPSNQPDRIFNDSSLSVTGWNFAIGLSSDLYRDKNSSSAQSNYYQAADGEYLAGSGSFFTLHEGISQTFAVARDTRYKLTFQMAPGGLNYDGSWIENASVSSSWLVELNGAVPSPISQSFNTNLAHFDASATTNPLVWTGQSLIFMSDSVGGNVTLQFSAYGDLTHVFLDDVVVVEYVPEPGSMVLLGIGSLVVAAARTRRTCRTRTPQR